MVAATRWDWLRASALLLGLMAVSGIVFCGCEPAPPEPTDTGGPSAPEISGPAPGEEEPVVPEEEPAAPEEEPAAPEKEPAAPEEKPAAAEEKPESEAMEPSEEASKEPAEPASEAADLDLNPPVSQYAPAEDLVAQVPEYIEEFEESVEDEEEYNDSVENIAKEANTMILIALGLGVHDTDNQYKAAAPAMFEASQALAAAEDYASAKAAVEALKESTTATGGNPSSSLAWGHVASLPELMKAVPLINTKMKRPLRNESRLERGADDMAGHAAVLAVIAQGSLDSVGDTEKPNEVDKWQAYCVDMREKCAAVGTAVRKFEESPGAKTYEATKAAVDALNVSCDECHAVFEPEAAAE